MNVTASKTTLRDYMAAHPGGLGMNDAVSLLLPVAFVLRDMHNRGEVHLELSPDSVTIGERGAALEAPTCLEADRYTAGFGAPEIYRGEHCGNLSDIYSFCALLRFAATGMIPVNALSRTEDMPSDGSSFEEAVRQGMALDAACRIASMQQLIVMISGYHRRTFVPEACPVQPVASVTQAVSDTPAVRTSSEMPAAENTPVVEEVTATEGAPVTEEKAEKLKGKVRPWLIAVIAVVAVLGALVGTYFGFYHSALESARVGAFEEAESALFLPDVTRLHDPQLVEYVTAGCLLEMGEHDSAKSAFQRLGGYLDAATYVKEADYRRALAMVEHDPDSADPYLAALEIMEGLSELGYRDSETQIDRINFRYAEYLLGEGEYAKALKLFRQQPTQEAQEMCDETIYRWANSLLGEGHLLLAYDKLASIPKHSGARTTLAKVKDMIYERGREAYRNGQCATARSCFDKIGAYKDVDRYYLLMDVRDGKITNADDLIFIIDFEDAAELLLWSQGIGKNFLEGTWRGGGRYFIMQEDGRIRYDLPWIRYGDYYRIKQGDILLYPENDYNDTRKLFTITVIDENTISVYCHKDGSTYRMIRQ